MTCASPYNIPHKSMAFTPPCTPPSSFYLSHTYNVSVRAGQIDGWKSKLLIATMGNVRVWAEKKRLSHFFPHLLLCVTLNQNILSGHLIPAFPDTTTGRMASKTAGFCLKLMINTHNFSRWRLQFLPACKKRPLSCRKVCRGLYRSAVPI